MVVCAFTAVLLSGIGWLEMSVPNIEMHIYGNGRHRGDALPDGSRMSGGLIDRNQPARPAGAGRGQ